MGILAKSLLMILLSGMKIRVSLDIKQYFILEANEDLEDNKEASKRAQNILKNEMDSLSEKLVRKFFLYILLLIYKILHIKKSMHFVFLVSVVEKRERSWRAVEIKTG